MNLEETLVSMENDIKNLTRTGHSNYCSDRLMDSYDIISNHRGLIKDHIYAVDNLYFQLNYKMSDLNGVTQNHKSLGCIAGIMATTAATATFSLIFYDAPQTALFTIFGFFFWRVFRT